jgi:hypothetical protein
VDKCDFRYAVFRRATLEDAKIKDCDLYRAVFEAGTVLAKTEMRHVSLTHAWLHGVVGLRRDNFAATPADPVLAAEADLYELFLKRTDKDRSSDFPLEEAVRNRLDEAALVYRHVTGVWASQGHYDDAAWAYVHTKELERDYAKAQRSDPKVDKPVRRRAWLRWFALTVADGLCRFGDSLLRVAFWIAMVAVIPGLIFWPTHAVRTTGMHPHPANAFLCVMFSAARLAAATPTGLATSGRVVDGIVIAQSIIGITLIGLLGFVLGNKLRSS